MRQLESCPACGSRSFRRAYSGRATRRPDDPKCWQLSRCTECDHGFLNPQPQWDEQADYYNADYDPYDPSSGLTDDFDATVESARAAGGYRHVAIRPGLRVLDVGCGGGSFLRVVKALGAQGRGVEPSPIASERARELGLDVAVGTLEQYAAARPDDCYDLITFSHVVEHLPDPIGTLSTAASLLDEGGTIWLAVPNGACDSARRLGWRWHSTDLPFHLHHFSPRSMRLAAERAGLRVRCLRTLSEAPGMRSSILLEWRYRWGIPRRISGRLLSQKYVDRLASRLDRDSIGQAILAELAADGVG